jgi:hypothetical protein
MGEASQPIAGLGWGLTTMSFSAHKRDALDATMPFNHRMSHLRSCAMLMGQKYRVPRSAIIERVLQLCGVDITISANEAEVQRAVQALVQVKELGLDDPAAPSADERYSSNAGTDERQQT